jgi:aldose 1-epimerase
MRCSEKFTVRDGVNLVTLAAGDATVEAAPNDGGTLASWRIAGVDVLRRRLPGQADPLRSACFPLAPFSNLIRGGGFHFRDRFYPMPRNHPLEPDPIHGDAWLSPWEVEELTDDRLLMSYRHTASTGFPFCYRVTQELALARRSLRVTLRLTNTDERVMPAGLGLHPYFNRPQGVRLQASHEGRWESQGIVCDRKFCLPEEIGDETLDACYTGWSGLARLHSPDDGVVVTLRATEPTCALVVYSPSSADFVCVEPVTHINDGFNAAAAGIPNTGVRELSPGKGMTLEVDISVRLREWP